MNTVGIYGNTVTIGDYLELADGSHKGVVTEIQEIVDYYSTEFTTRILVTIQDKNGCKWKKDIEYFNIEKK